jgi:hypothetical protein
LDQFTKINKDARRPLKRAHRNLTLRILNARIDLMSGEPHCSAAMSTFILPKKRDPLPGKRTISVA